ncbi:dynein regulatory complex subunit 2 [Latimeria chalumnae]|uniref:dynein regulatory complex subunit 2 n=1 Tax=Latimeria chalumnae TaxID=7897 RepID=UPI00313B4AE6
MPKKGKRGKGKGNKLANMTEEERLLFMQQKLLAEEEMNKKKEDLLNQFLKDKLAKEERNSIINLNKINQQWRMIMRESKSKELKRDIEILSQTFERVVDRKDSVIKSLAKDLEESEEQYLLALRSHLQSVEQLLDLQLCRLQQLQEEYETELEALKQEYDMERELLLAQHKMEMTQLHDIMFAMEQNFMDHDNEVKQEYQSVRDEIKNKDLEDKHALRVQLEGIVEDLWRQFQHALKCYNDATEDRKMAFEPLKARDEKSAKEIEMQMKKLQKIQDQIMALKSKMALNMRECEERNRKLREEKEVIHRHFQILKAEMNRIRAGEKGRLAKLTMESNRAIRVVKKVCEKGEQIMRLTEMCRKLETEEEKVLPFYTTSLSAEELKEAEEAALEKPSEPLAKLMHNYTALENFWKRYNKGLLDKYALGREKSLLLQENEQLRLLLKQYLDGISVNEETLTQLNTLFIVNSQTNINMNIPVTDGRVKKPATTVIEAAHVVKHLT